MEIQGKWRGYYEYGLGYTLPFFGQRVDMEVEFKGNNDSFTGKVSEVETEFSVKLPGEIKGYIENDFISFTKTYPKTPRIIEVFNYGMNYEAGEAEIVHDGFFDDTNYAMYGGWEIIDRSMEAGEYYQNNGQGIWMLKKVY